MSSWMKQAEKYEPKNTSRKITRVPKKKKEKSEKYKTFYYYAEKNFPDKLNTFKEERRQKTAALTKNPEENPINFNNLLNLSPPAFLNPNLPFSPEILKTPPLLTIQDDELLLPPTFLDPETFSASETIHTPPPILTFEDELDQIFQSIP